MSKLVGVWAYGIVSGTLAITGCGKVVEAAPSLVSSSLSFMPTALITNQPVQMAAIQTTEPSTIEDVTQTVLWESSSSSDLFVSPEGKATCKHIGIFQVTISTIALKNSTLVSCHAPAPAPPAPAPPAPPAPPTTPTPPAPPTTPAVPPTSPTLIGITILNAPSALPSNLPIALHAQGTYADQSSADVTSQTVWKGDKVASVNSKGVMYCNTAGKSTITATIGSSTFATQVQCFMKQITAAPGFRENSLKFHGPFSSWLNVQSYGAKGDGISDDTGAFNAVIADAIARHKVVYIPHGSYMITRELRVTQVDGFSMTGENPLTTRIFWNGAVGGTMITFDGSSHFRTRRIWWDGNKRADVGINIEFVQAPGQLYPTWNGIEDSKLSQCGTGIKPAYAGEVTVNRVHFDQNTFGVNLNNWNAQNFNVMDSLFTGNVTGITNIATAGAYNVSNSVFVGSTVADMEIGNALTFSIRHNLSVHSRRFLYDHPINSGNPVTIEGNVIVDTIDVPIVYAKQGTVTMIDNYFDMPSNPQRTIFLAQGWKTAYVLSIGNIYSATKPYEAQAGSTINVTSMDEAPQTTVAASAWEVPTETYVPLASNDPVVEVAEGATSDDIQNAINDAARVSSGTTVHIPASEYSINTPIDVPNAPGLTIVGDGQNTHLRNGPMLIGPTLRTHGSIALDSLFISGSTIDAALRVLVEDQPSTRILCDECTTVSTKTSMVVSGLDHAYISTRASTLNGDQGVVLTGGPNQKAGKLTLGHMDAFMSTSDTYTIKGGGHFLISDGWHDGNQRGGQAVVSDNSMVTEEGSSICTSSPAGVQVAGFRGQLALVGTQVQTTVTADATSTGTIGMIGTDTGAPTQLMTDVSTVNVIHAADTINAPDGIVLVTNTPDAVADIERTLSQSRTEFVVPRETMTVSGVLVRIDRVMAADGLIGMSFSSDKLTASAATYSLAAPSNSGVSVSCSAGTLSTDGSWSLVSGGDGFYGLLSGGVYLSNSIAATSGANLLEAVSSMTDAGQRWLMQPAGDGLFRLVNRADGAFLTRTASGCATIGASTGDASQEWLVTAR